MPSKSELVRAKLAKKPNPTPEEIKEWAKDIGCSPSLVYKWRAKLPEEVTRVVEAGEPVVRVDEEPEIIEEEPVEEGEFEPPTEEEEREAPAEEVPAEVIEEEEAEEERRLREIGGRALARLFDVAIEDVLNLEKAGLSRQESDDTHFLALLMIAKYLKVEVKEYMLEVTSGLHFGSVGLKLLVKWIKKKRAESKKKEEVRKTEEKEEAKEEIAPGGITETVETPTEKASEEKVPMCVECGKQPVAPDSKAGLCLQCQKKFQSRYVKKVAGGM